MATSKKGGGRRENTKGSVRGWSGYGGSNGLPNGQQMDEGKNDYCSGGFHNDILYVYIHLNNKCWSFLPYNPINRYM
jgi:hypothetical protein